MEKRLTRSPPCSPSPSSASGSCSRPSRGSRPRRSLPQPSRPLPPAAAASSPASPAAPAPAPRPERLPTPGRRARRDAGDARERRSCARPSPTAARSLTSLVLLRHTDDQKQPLELVRALPAPAAKPLALDFPGNPELTGRVAGALFAVERSPTARCASATPTTRSPSTKEIPIRRRVPLRREGHRRRSALHGSSPGPGLRNPDADGAGVPLRDAGDGRRRDAGRVRSARAPRSCRSRPNWPLPSDGFAGIEDNYFLAVLAPPTARRRARGLSRPAHATRRASPRPTIGAGRLAAAATLAARAYFGPKDVEILESTDLGLERTVDFGWYGILARPLLWLLEEDLRLVAGNWGVAILARDARSSGILLFPLMHKSYASMKKMQKLAPKMNAIRDKYKKAKTDAAQRQKMNAGADGALPGGGLQPDERLLPGPAAASDPRRLLQRAVARDRAAPRAVRPLDQRPLGDRRQLRAASS